MKRAICGLVFAAFISAGGVPISPHGHSSPIPPVPQAAGLSERDIRDAMDWGLGAIASRGKPEPYMLGAYPGTHPRSTLGAIGTLPLKQHAAVFTPFLRIALAARSAADAHRAFARQDVTPEMADPLLWVAAFAFDPFPGSSRPTGDRLLDINDVIIAPGGGASSTTAVIFEPPESRAARVTWKDSDFRRLRKVLGLNVSARGVLAAFPREAFKPGRDLVMLFAPRMSVPDEAASGPRFVGLRVSIREADLATWR